MTEEFKNLISEAINEGYNETFTKLYEENKQYMKPYEQIVLEAIKTFDFSKGDFNDELLKIHTELVGKPEDCHIYLDREKNKASISLSYFVDTRYPEHKKYVKPKYLKNSTYSKPYMKELLEEQGIQVSCNQADGWMSSSDYYSISFDATELINAIDKQKSEIKRKTRTR